MQTIYITPLSSPLHSGVLVGMARRIRDGNSSLTEDGGDDDVEETDSRTDLGLSLEKLNLGPTIRKKLIVLGLGGLLCQRVCRRDTHKIPRFRAPDSSYGSILVYRRPHCEDFIKFCLEKFEVGIWSSAKEWYLNAAMDSIMKGLSKKILFAWDQTECTDSGFKNLENKHKPIFLKELKKVWGKKFSFPGVGFSSSNTLLIDNDPYKALLNPPHTAIFPDEYKAELVDDADLGPTGELRLYLDKMSEAEDVSTFVANNPFGNPAITPRHADWNFYSKIIRRFEKNQLP